MKKEKTSQQATRAKTAFFFMYNKRTLIVFI